MSNIIVPSNSILEEFRRELWKDQRSLEVIETKNGQRFVKTFDDEFDVETEVRALRILEQELGKEYVPHVYSQSKLSITMDYLKGIRVFNLFVELDNLSAIGNSKASNAKNKLMNRCMERQSSIQKVLYKHRKSIAKNRYPVANKIKSIIRILSEPLSLSINWKIINKELNLLDNYWGSAGVVPFRDSTTKNMVLCDPGLWIGNFTSEDQRRVKIEQYLLSSNTDWISSLIMDFDFTSVSDLTTPEDDPISLLLHERQWQGAIFKPKDLIWLKEEKTDNYRAAVTLIIRYFRFGGRKLSYKLLHPRAHCTRFRYDNGDFYFERLTQIVKSWSLKAANDYKGILEFASIVESVVKNKTPAIDYFLSKYSETRKEYYLDMYPD